MSHSWSYPIPSRPLTPWERLAKLLKHTAGYCMVCRRWTLFRAWTWNYRDSGVCARCGSFNRQRQIAHVIGQLYNRDPRYRALYDNELIVYNTEARGCFHAQLSRSTLTNYTASEYLGPDVEAGSVLDGIRHEDVQSLSFPSASLDLVISSDVWEHVPAPYRGHEEVLRVLRPGGHHVFTVPFHQTQVLDDRRAAVDTDGAVSHFAEPIYHGDPMSPEGVLVYTIFSLEMLSRLEHLGFETKMHRLYSPRLGILGPNALVFDATRPSAD